MAELKINCLVRGQNPTYGFSVWIKEDANVSELKDAIKEKRAGLFATRDAALLELWVASDAVSENYKESEAKGPGKRKLEGGEGVEGYWPLENPFVVLKDVFRSSLKRDTIHIFVSPPTGDINDNKRKKLGGNVDEPQDEDERLENKEYHRDAKVLYEYFWGKDPPDLVIKQTITIPDLYVDEPNTIEAPSQEIKAPPPKAISVIQMPGNANFPFGQSKIFVKDVYEEFLNICERDDKLWKEENVRSVSPYHASIISGQPGIGKTVFLSYLLVRRLQEKKKTIFCDDAKFAYIFSEQGFEVKMLNASTIDIPGLKDVDCCILVNLSDDMKKPPSIFHPKKRNARVVLATSPSQEHLDSFSVETAGLIYYMPLWKWDDIYASSLLRQAVKLGDPKYPPALKGVLVSRLRDAFLKLAGIPRLCNAALVYDGALDHHLRTKVEVAINDVMAYEHLGRNASGTLPFSTKTSHSFVKVEPVDVSRLQFKISLLSVHVAGMVLERLYKWRNILVSESLMHLLQSPETHSIAGTLFEEAVHRYFRRGVTIKPTKVTKGAPDLTITIPPVEHDAYGFYHTLQLRKTPKSPKVDEKFINQYLRPWSKTAASIDSVWVSEDVTVFFQITVSRYHPLKQFGLNALTDRLPAQAKKRVALVFVVPDDKGTLNFPEQTITVAPGNEPGEESNYPQYVYYVKFEEFDVFGPRPQAVNDK